MFNFSNACSMCELKGHTQNSTKIPTIFLPILHHALLAVKCQNSVLAHTNFPQFKYGMTLDNMENGGNRPPYLQGRHGKSFRYTWLKRTAIQPSGNLSRGDHKGHIGFHPLPAVYYPFWPTARKPANERRTAVQDICFGWQKTESKSTKYR